MQLIDEKIQVEAEWRTNNGFDECCRADLDAKVKNQFSRCECVPLMKKKCWYKPNYPNVITRIALSVAYVMS